MADQDPFSGLRTGPWVGANNDSLFKGLADENTVVPGGVIEDQSITNAKITNLNAEKIDAGTLSVTGSMKIQTTGASPQLEVSSTGTIMRDNAGLTILEINGATTTLNADIINAGTINGSLVDVTNIDADNINAGALTLTPLSDGSGNAIVSTNFTVSNAGVITASSGTIGGYTLASDRLTNNGGGAGEFSGLIDTSGSGLAFFSGATDTAGTDAKFTVSNTGAVTARDLTVIPLTSEQQGIDAAAGAITLEPPTAFGAVILKVTNSDGTGDYDSVGFTSSAGAAANAPATVVTDAAHNLKAGQFVSFHSVETTWNTIDASKPIQIITTPTTTSFTVEHFAILPAVASNSAGTIRAYKRLSIRAAGGLYVYRNGTNAGDIAAGSLVLGDNLANYGKDSLATVADGELAFIKAATPRYGSGANLYSSNGTTNINTSGNLVVGGTLTATTISATNYGLVAGDIPTLTLGTDTAGNYVSGLTGGTGVTISGTAGEGWSPSVAIGQAVATSSSPTFAGLTTTGNTTLGNATSDQIKFLNLLQTSTITNSYSAIRLYNAAATVPWRAFVDSSSERFKSNIVYEDASDAILDLSSVSYHDKLEFEERGEEAPRQRGFLAEEVAANPDGETFVVFNAEGQADAIQYDRLVVPLHSAMRKLRERIQDLESRLAALEGA